MPEEAIEFSVGDVVFLKSGGIAMTVECLGGVEDSDGDYVPEDSVQTCWHDKRGRANWENFKTACLMHEPPECEGCEECERDPERN